MLKLKLQYFGHLMQRADSLEKILILGKIEGKKRRVQQRIRWLDNITNSVGVNLRKLQERVKDREACLVDAVFSPDTLMKLGNSKKRVGGFPGGTSGKEPACQCWKYKKHGFDSQVRSIPWRRTWQPTPVFLQGKSHGQRSMAGCSTWVLKEST